MPVPTITSLNNAAQDVAHISTVATSTSTTATDRLGNVKLTVKGAVDTLKAYNSRGAWVTASAYALKDLVVVSGVWYVCVEAHTSSAAFATDIAKWRVHQGLTTADLSYLLAGGESPYKHGAIGNGIADDTAAILAAVATGKSVNLGGYENVFLISSPIVLSEGQYFFGLGATLKSTTNANLIVLANRAQVDGVRILGSNAASAQYGVYGTVVSRTRVTNCHILNCGGGGYYMSEIVDVHQGNNVTNNCVSNCGIGVHIANRGEYTTVGNNNIDTCTTGYKIIGGNTIIVGGVVSNCTDNINVSAGENDAHGRCVGVLFNHATAFAVRVDSINVPDFKFDNCDFYYGDVYLKNCSGVMFNNCVFESNSFYFENAIDNYFVGCHFKTTPTMFHRYAGTQSKTHFVDCKTATGGASSGDINSGYLQAKVTSGLTFTTSATEQVVKPGTLLYNAMAHDLAYTYALFYDTATGAFQNFVTHKSLNRNWSMPVHMAFSVGGNVLTADFANVSLYIKDSTGKYLGSLTPSGITFGAGADTYKIYDFCGNIPIGDFKIYILNNSGKTFSIYPDIGANYPGTVTVTGF